MEEEIELSFDENMNHCMTNEETDEHSFQRMVNDSVQIINHDNPEFDNLNNSMEIRNQEGVEREEEEQQKDSEAEETVDDGKNQEETPEIQQPLYKLNVVDTEASIKTEVRQLIFTKASDEIRSEILTDTAYEIQENIENLKNRTDLLVNETENLEKEVITDENRLTQFEEMLQKTNEMIVLLRKNVNTFVIRQEDNHINNFLDKCVQQQKILESIKTTYHSKFKNGKQTLNSLDLSSSEHNANLRAELAGKRQVLSRLKKQVDDLQRILLTRNGEIEKATAEKNILEEKKSNKGASKTELIEQKNVLEDVCTKRESQIERLDIINKNQEKLRNEIEESGSHLNEITSNITYVEQKIAEKFNRRNKLREDLDFAKCKQEESVKQLQNNLDNINVQLNTLLSNLTRSTVNHDDLLQKLHVLNKTFIQKNDEKIICVNETLERQNTMNEMKIEIMKKQFEHETEQEKCIELENQYGEIMSELNILKDRITAQKENIEYDIRKIKADYYDAQSQSDKTRTEIKKKREYMLANAKFLIEKSENLCNEMNETANCVKNLQHENITIKALLQKKLVQLNEYKTKLNTCKQNSEINLKFTQETSGKENIKKVQFNEVVSFKSLTSSENSVIPVENTENLNTSLHNWLQDDKFMSAEK